MSYYAPVCIFVKSDTVVDGFGLNCLAWDQAPSGVKRQKRKKFNIVFLITQQIKQHWQRS